MPKMPSFTRKRGHAFLAMKSVKTQLVVLLLALLSVAVLPSCGRVNYAFGPNAPAYHGVKQPALLPLDNPIVPVRVDTLARAKALAVRTVLVKKGAEKTKKIVVNKATLPATKKPLGRKNRIVQKVLTLAARPQRNTAGAKVLADEPKIAFIQFGIGLILMIIGSILINGSLASSFLGLGLLCAGIIAIVMSIVMLLIYLIFGR